MLFYIKIAHKNKMRCAGSMNDEHETVLNDIMDTSKKHLQV